MSPYKSDCNNTGNKNNSNHKSVGIATDVEYISTISNIIGRWK